MQYQISHITTYHYSQPVTLKPHLVRLCPRSNGWQQIQSFSLLVTPSPLQQAPTIDLDGNAVIKLWFEPQQQTEKLVLRTLTQVVTYQDNPFIFLLEPWALRLPIDYPTSLYTQLLPYLTGQQLPYGGAIDPVALHLAQTISQQTNADPIQFLTTLTQEIYQQCRYQIRETGEPLPPGITWSSKTGSCRDLTVLFVEVCRAIGMAARFVSGYHEGDPNHPDRHLHAWAEVYLPGAGWRGYDPTLGLSVADRHIALAASAVASYTAPIVGEFSPATGSASMSYTLQIQTFD
jgi:transglutaminase-like putative cysteine protease